MSALIKIAAFILLISFSCKTVAQNTAQASPSKDSATVILQNISRSNFVWCSAVIKSHLVSTRNLKPGQSKTFKISLAGSSLYKFTISLDKDQEYTYSIEPADYIAQVSSEELTSGTYQYLIDYDKKLDAISVKLVKVN